MLRKAEQKGLAIVILVSLCLVDLVCLNAPTRGAELRGSLVIKGSDTLLPLAQAWAEAFMKKHPAVNVSVSGGGSGVGIAALINGTCDIANTSREMKSAELKKAKDRNFIPVETKVAIDGISIIVNPKNPIRELTIDQLKAIYEGRYKDWSELGGSGGKIIAVGRDTASGTYEFFKDKVLKGAKYRPDAIATPSNNAIANIVSKDIGAIGYVGFAYAEKFQKRGKVKIVAVAKDKKSEALMPTEEHIKEMRYPISRYLYNYSRGKPKGLVKVYLDFVLGEEGQKIVAEVGYVPVK